MSTMKLFFTCLQILIKKKFFNSCDSYFSDDCKTIVNENFFKGNKIEKSAVEEYFSTYLSTTRWQTL